MRIGGHRGWRAAHAENTLAGIQAAIPHVDFVEIDVRWTVDGVPVLSHDPVVNGVSIPDTTAAALAAGAETAHVPTLASLLAACPDLPLDIELKHVPGDGDFDPSFDRPVAAASLARRGDVVTSFHWPTLAEIKQRVPRVLTGVLVAPPDSLEDAVAEALSQGHRFVVPHHRMIETAAQVSAIHRQGLLVGVWTVNDPEEARVLVDYGVDAIVTDDPPRINAEVRP